MAIQAARKAGKYVGICGQGPSDHPDFAAWLVEQGIELCVPQPGYSGRYLVKPG
ncbi:hypothetical protein ACLK2B_09090 [Escherichia coli]